VLGSDFANKTKGIGPATILAKGPGVTLTEEQEIASAHFLSECPYDIKMIHRDTPDIPELIAWLVEKNFNRDRVTKLTQGFNSVD
jgi:hypothetical protein